MGSLALSDIPDDEWDIDFEYAQRTVESLGSSC